MKKIKRKPDRDVNRSETAALSRIGRPLIVDGQGRPIVDGEAKEIKRKVEATTLAGIRRKELPCCLCDLEIMHGAIEGDAARLIFRAQKHLGVWWVPVKDAAHLAQCPDPHPSTVAFWRNDAERERYKAHRREQARKRRGIA